ncbi:hypothetical protein [Streptomyces lavenduligriseus]|uniref:Uncharacterized protein n=1 Tax=Streptomyces lavenduligriseus TaxID=67315 RepID=A0ABT0P397_9ACTN|nr:hypothetical protein [Streptomyces lavenduligriseus]MCL3998202.1 hypothetical protein [Streptomyces lavenduligriseus]
MPPQAALALTEDRRRCTGESHQALCALLEATGGPLTIPAARHPEQARLETAVFLACCKIGGLSEHPLGIVQVRPGEDQLALRLVNEPSILYYWAEFLLPRLNDCDEFSAPQDWITGVPGLRYRREKGGVCLYRPGMPASILLTGFSPHQWDRIVDRLTDYNLLQPRPDWAPEERAAYAAAAATPYEPPSIYSPLLRRVRATAGPGPVNGTDAWQALGHGVRLETTDGPPCPDLIRLLGDGPTGLGWEVAHKRCTCLCDHIHSDVGCNIDFREPTTGRFVYYSNAKRGRTLDDHPRQRSAEENRTAFA